MGIVEMIREREIKALSEEFMEKGREEGREEVREEVREVKAKFVKNLLEANLCTVSQIAKIAGVTEDYVRKIKKSPLP